MSLSSEGVKEINQGFNPQTLGTSWLQTVNLGHLYPVNENSQSTILENFIKILESNYFLQLLQLLSKLSGEKSLQKLSNYLKLFESYTASGNKKVMLLVFKLLDKSSHIYNTLN